MPRALCGAGGPPRGPGFYSSTCQHWLQGDPRAYAVRGTGKPFFKETQIKPGVCPDFCAEPFKDDGTSQPLPARSDTRTWG